MWLTLLRLGNGIAILMGPQLSLTNTTRSVTSLMGIIMIGACSSSTSTSGGAMGSARRSRAAIRELTNSTVLTLVLVPTLYVMLEERFPRRVQAPDGEPVLQGDPA